MYKKIVIITLLILGLIVRLYKINNPIADWHSFRQADTASVTNKYLENRIDILHPKYHDLSDVQSGKYNVNGYRMVELPIYNILCAGTYKIASIFKPNIEPEITYRFTSILLSLTSAFVLYLISFSLTSNFWASTLVMASFLFIPFNIYYSRAILPEPLAVLTMLLTVFFFKKNKILSAVFFAMALLVKPFTGIIIFPILLVFVFNKFSFDTFLKSIPKYLIFCLISLIPFILWRKWIGNFPEGIPVSGWLLNNSTSKFIDDYFGKFYIGWLNKIVAFRPYWFRWLFYERINKLILGSFGLIFVYLGLAYKKNTTQKFTVASIIGVLLYFIIVAQGNIQHDYYQTLIIPSISFLVGYGIYYSLTFLFKNKIWAFITTFGVLSFSFYFSWDLVKEYYRINNPGMITVGKEINKILPKNAILIAPYQGDTAFLYQTRRDGYPTEIYEVNKILELHPNQPHYLVSLNNDTYTNLMAEKYKTLQRNDQFIILDLTDEIKK